MKTFSKVTRTAAAAFIAAGITTDSRIKAVKNAHFLGKAKAADVIKCVDAMLDAAKVAEEAKAAKLSVVRYKWIKAKLDAVAACFRTGHSMGSVTFVRAGKYKRLENFGKDIYTIRYKVEGKSDTRQHYARSSKWQAGHGSLCMDITMKEAVAIEVIGGVPTVKIQEVAPDVFGVKVWEMVGSKGSAKIVTRGMFLVGDYHAETLDEAMAHRVTAVARQTSKAAAMRRFVGLEHSKKVGNCEVGTRGFANRHGLDIEMGYSVGYLLSLEPDNKFVKRLLTTDF